MYSPKGNWTISIDYVFFQRHMQSTDMLAYSLTRQIMVGSAYHLVVLSAWMSTHRHLVLQALL